MVLRFSNAHHKRTASVWPRRLGLFFTALGLPIVFYLLFAALLGIVQVHRDYRESLNGEEIFLRSNGVHTDLIVPKTALEGHGLDALSAAGPSAATTPYLAFGWGDRAFYLETPTWAEFKLGVALRALSGTNPSVMHVEALARPEPSSEVRALRLNRFELERLVTYLNRSFARDALGNLEPIAGQHYGIDDRFYEALGHYSAFSTCNEWVRGALAFAGLRVPVWAPFAPALFYGMRPSNAANQGAPGGARTGLTSCRRLVPRVRRTDAGAQSRRSR